MTSVLLALSGLADEADLVRAAPTVGLTVARRCVDAVDLLAAAAADHGSAVVLASGLPRLTPDLLSRLGDRTIIGVAADSLGRERLMRLGIDPVVDVAPSAQTTMQQVGDICRARRATDRAVAHPVEGPDELPVEDPIAQTAVPVRSTPARTPRPAAGLLAAVWGPPGAPGRTTVAMALAEVLAQRGHQVALVDADTYAPSIAAGLGLVEPTSGLLTACRLAEAGTLTAAGLTALTMPVAAPTVRARGRGARPPGAWRVLGGIDRVGRWPELRAAAVDRLWAVARSAFDVTVVDVGFCLEVDDAPGAWGRQRNAAALSAVQHGDRVIAVAEGSAQGALRFLAGWPDLGEETGRPATSVVCNRADRRVGQWRSAVHESLGRIPVHEVPDEPRAVQAAWDRGLTLGEVSRGSRILRALDDLAVELTQAATGGERPGVRVPAA